MDEQGKKGWISKTGVNQKVLAFLFWDFWMFKKPVKFLDIMRTYIVSGLISLIIGSGIGCDSISERRRERLIKDNVPEDYNQVIERSKKREDYELEEIRRKLGEEELKSRLNKKRGEKKEKSTPL